MNGETSLNEIIDARLKELGLLEEKTSKKGGKSKKAEPEDDGEVTLETLKEKVTALVNKNGKDAAKALLKKAKVDKLSDLDEKHYEAFNKKLDEELGEGDDDEDLFGD